MAVSLVKCNGNFCDLKFYLKIYRWLESSRFYSVFSLLDTFSVCTAHNVASNSIF